MNTVHETSYGPGVVKVAVVQAAPALFDTPRSLQKLADLTASAARQKAELVVFPEAFIGGYPKGHDFGVRLKGFGLGMRIACLSSGGSEPPTAIPRCGRLCFCPAGK